MLLNLYRRHLYVRIWLAVVAGVVILTLTANWIVREAAESERERLAPVPREVVGARFDTTSRSARARATRVPGAGLDVRRDARATAAPSPCSVAPRSRPPGGPPPGIAALAHALRPGLDGRRWWA